MDLSRTKILIGEEGLARLKSALVLLYGLGGVGGFAFEALVRAGVGTVHVFDFDTVQPSNMNRQILCLNSTLGMLKVDVAEIRAAEINPEVRIVKCSERITSENAGALVPAGLGFAIDAIDEIEPKVHLIKNLLGKKIPFVSCMGAGSRLDPFRIKIADIKKTSLCPLARSVRKRLREMGIEQGVRCIYSEENLGKSSREENEGFPQRRVQGTISYMPAIFGMAAAGVIIQDILNSGKDGS